MLFPEFHYIGYKTEVNRKTKIYDLNNLELPVGKEAYASVYRFDKAVAELGSLADLPPGTLAYPDWVLFDFDSKDLEEAYSDAKVLCERIRHLIGNFVFISFSGGKGFHVCFRSCFAGIEPTAETDNIKRFANLLAGDLKTWDPSVYNKTRIFRVDGSFNLGGGKFKVSIEEDWDLEKVLEVASQANGEIYQKPNSFMAFSPNPVLSQLYEKACQKEATQTHSRVVTDYEPKQGGSLFAKAEEGKRNETAYTVARRLARRGIPLQDARKVMGAVWNPEACQPPLSPSELQKVVENAYSKGVNEFVDEGSYAGKIFGIKDGLADISKRFQSQQTGFQTGYEMLDNYTMGFGPEELIWIVGRSGSFKSAFLTNILQRGSKLSKKPALYFSMEMGPETLLPRTIQQSERITKKAVIEAMRAGRPYTDFQKTIDDFEFVKFVYLSNLTTEQVLGLVDYYMETYGELSAIGFDYLGLFKGANNNTERTAKQAQELKTIICKAARCPVFCLAQAKQIYEGREGDIELDRTCPKDSDSILDLGDYAIGLWGHWTQDPNTGEDTKYQFGRFFKSRGMAEDAYGVNPYFGLNLDKQFMCVNDVVHMPFPPLFKNKSGEKE